MVKQKNILIRCSKHYLIRKYFTADRKTNIHLFIDKLLNYFVSLKFANNIFFVV